jgi:hypothetical protein
MRLYCIFVGHLVFCVVVPTDCTTYSPVSALPKVSFEACVLVDCCFGGFHAGDNEEFPLVGCDAMGLL